MATPEQIAELRFNIKEPNNVEPYTDEFLGAMIDAYGVNTSTSKVWTGKAASVAHLMDISEGGSSRKMSDLHKNYLTIAAAYEDGTADPSGDAYVAPTTSRITRV